MLSCIYHNIDNQQRDRCVATRGSFELLHSVVYIYIETKHGGIYTLRSSHVHIFGKSICIIMMLLWVSSRVQ